MALDSKLFALTTRPGYSISLKCPECCRNQSRNYGRRQICVCRADVKKSCRQQHLICNGCGLWCFRFRLGLGCKQPFNGNVIELRQSQSELPHRLQLRHGGCPGLQGAGGRAALLGNQDDVSGLWNGYGTASRICKGKGGKKK